MLVAAVSLLLGISARVTDVSFDVFDSELCAPLRLDRGGVVLRAGRGWHPLMDWSPEELEGRELGTLVLPEHQARLRRGLERVFLEAPSSVVRADTQRGGRRRTFRFRFELDGEEAISFVEDVTEVRAVLQSNSQVESLVDFAADAWFVHDLEGRIREANPWACEALGYSRDELVGMRVAEVETTIQPGRLDGIWNRMEVGKPRTVEGLQRRKDGSLVPVEVRLGLFLTDDGETLMLAIARDITRRKAQEAELQRMNEGLERDVAVRTRELRVTLAERQAMLDHLQDGIVAIDRGATIRLTNPALVELLDLDEDPMGRAAADALPEKLAALLETVLAQPEAGEVQLELKGGRVAIAHGVAFSDGPHAGAVALLRDVTEAMEVDRMKTDFIATVSHELRTPLTSVLGFAKLCTSTLERKVLPHPLAQDPGLRRHLARVLGNLEIVASEGTRLTELINDLLDISKMESGNMEWVMGSVEPGALASRAAQACSSLFEEDGPVRLVLRVEDGLPPVRGDADRLLQVLLNLLSNAAKFTSEGEVCIAVDAAGLGVRFTVSDTGEGIAPDDYAAVFDRFRQVGDTLTDRPKGSGLGLAICQQIAAAHASVIEVESRRGEGSRFFFTLGPVTQQVEVHVDHLVQQVEEVAELPPASGAGVLVVDDDRNLRDLLEAELSEHGYRVRTAGDGVQAMEAVRRELPDLVILDVRMPRLSGFDVAAMLRGDPATAGVPILVLSIVREHERALRLGLEHYLSKPVDNDALLRQVADLVERDRTPLELVVVRGT